VTGIALKLPADLIPEKRSTRSLSFPLFYPSVLTLRFQRFHDLSHTFASRLVRNGVDIITVRDLLGHYSVEVTQRYTHSNASQKRQAVETLEAADSEEKDSVHTVSTQKGPDPEAHSSSMN
jgi:integrase